MRLTPTQHQQILQATRLNFGANANVWLFGSRVDDSRRGGDVDLYVETDQASTLLSALRCKIELEESLDLHVDLVVKEEGKNKPIYQIKKTRYTIMTGHLHLIIRQLTHLQRMSEYLAHSVQRSRPE